MRKSLLIATLLSFLIISATAFAFPPVPPPPNVSDTAYDAGTWDSNTDAASKNAIRDKIETLAGGHDAATLTGDDANATDGTQAMTIAGGGIVATTVAGSTVTVTGTEVDGDTTNEINTITGDDANTTTGLAITVAGAGIAATTVAGDTVTVTATEVDSVVGAITGIVMSDGGGNISAAASGTDYAAADHDATHAVSGADTVFPADPGADRYLMWDDDPGALVWSEVSAGGGLFDAVTGIGTAANATLQKADPALIFDGSTASDTDYWMGLTADEGGDDDDLLQWGDGTTPGTNPHMSLDTSGRLLIGTTDNDNTPAVGRLTIKGTTSDGTTYPFVLRDLDEANVFAIASNGSFTMGRDLNTQGGSLRLQITDNTVAGFYNNYSYRTQNTDRSSGDVHRFENAFGAELTDTDAEQSFLKVVGAANQSSTASYNGIKGVFTETGIGSGATGTGGTNNLLVLGTAADEDMFKITNAGFVRHKGGIAHEPSADQARADDSTITISNTIVRVVGDGGAAVLDADPAIADGVEDGQIVIIQGTDDSNTVQIADSVNTQLNGAAAVTLGQGDIIQLVWDAGDSTWYECYRSNN